MEHQTLIQIITIFSEQGMVPCYGVYRYLSELYSNCYKQVLRIEQPPLEGLRAW